MRNFGYQCRERYLPSNAVAEMREQPLSKGPYLLKARRLHQFLALIE